MLEGNRGHRPMDLSQVFRPETGEPDIPRYLSKEGRKAWKRLVPELIRYNLLSKVDRDAFGMLCATIGRLELIETAIARKTALLIEQDRDPELALLDTTPNGLRVQSALYQVLNKEQSKLHRMLESFGLRPDARANVTTAIRGQLKLFENPTEPTKPDAPKPGGVPQSFADF